MSTLGPIAAAVGLQHAQQLSQVQMAVAAKALRIADSQGSAALKLIESAADAVSSAASELSQSLGQMVDVRA